MIFQPFWVWAVGVVFVSTALYQRDTIWNDYIEAPLVRMQLDFQGVQNATAAHGITAVAATAAAAAYPAYKVSPMMTTMASMVVVCITAVLWVPNAFPIVMLERIDRVVNFGRVAMICMYINIVTGSLYVFKRRPKISVQTAPGQIRSPSAIDFSNANMQMRNQFNSCTFNNNYNSGDSATRHDLDECLNALESRM